MIAGVLYFTNTSPLHEERSTWASTLDPGLLFGARRARPDVRRGLSGVRVAAPRADSSGRTMARGGERARVRQRVRARRVERVVHPRAGRAPRGAVPLLHVRDGAASTTAALGTALQSRAAPARVVRGLAAASALASWVVCQRLEADWVPPFLMGGLLCHYWLDGRIWTSRARQLAAS